MRLADSGGLYLEVAPNKSKRWFWKCLFAGKETRIAAGHYAEVGSTTVRVGLKAARGAQDEARKLQRGGSRPAPTAREAQQANDRGCDICLCRTRTACAEERRLGGRGTLSDGSSA